jgi:hypothetical protein
LVQQRAQDKKLESDLMMGWLFSRGWQCVRQLNTTKDGKSMVEV